MLKNFIKEYLSFTRSEKRGIAVLLSIIVLLLIFWRVAPLFIGHGTQSTEVFKNEINSFRNSIKKDTSLITIKNVSELFEFNPNTASDEDFERLGLKSYQIKNIRNFLLKGGSFKTKDDFKKMWSISPELYSELAEFIVIPSVNNTENNIKSYRTEKQRELHEFDPNCTSEEDWMKFGLSKKQVAVIQNYLSKGGKFKTKEDLKKMYCIPPELFLELEPFINIHIEKKVNEADDNIAIEINSADSAELRKIKKISPYLAGKIVKYRSILGGFYKKEQLLEIWGMKPEIYNAIEKSILLDKSTVKKITLNTATFSDLARHPYVKYEYAKEILNYKRIMSKISNPEELVKNKIVPDSIYYKMKPYIE